MSLYTPTSMCGSRVQSSSLPATVILRQRTSSLPNIAITALDLPQTLHARIIPPIPLSCYAFLEHTHTHLEHLERSNTRAKHCVSHYTLHALHLGGVWGNCILLELESCPVGRRGIVVFAFAFERGGLYEKYD